VESIPAKNGNITLTGPILISPINGNFPITGTGNITISFGKTNTAHSKINGESNQQHTLVFITAYLIALSYYW
jgi:hypothetical protein